MLPALSSRNPDFTVRLVKPVADIRCWNSPLNFDNAGPSSNFAFLRMLSRVVAREKLVPKWAPPIQPWFPVVDRSKPSAAENSVDSPGQSQSDDGQSITDLGDLYALPSPEQTSELLHQYFAHINLLYPILHEESFLRTYREMAKGERDARPSYLALLNIVLALAQTSIYTPQGAQERMRQSQAYYERAVSICKRPPVRGIRLETSKPSCCASSLRPYLTASSA